MSNSLSCIGGKANGVGLFSSYPCRTLPCSWPPHLTATARVHAGAVCCDNNWIKIGTFYGYAKAPKSVATQARSDELLELLTNRIIHDSKGFRVICGDFNQDIRALNQTEEWSRLGFVEVQEYAWLKWGRPVQMTSKGQQVRDYLWISPELIPFLESVHTDETWFADHAILYAQFRPIGKHEPTPIWRKPCPIPWDECGNLEEFTADLDSISGIKSGSSDTRLQAIMELAENAADEALRSQGKPGLHSSQRGRARTKDVTWGRFQTVPTKIDRGNECDPTFTGEHFTHHLWLRQLRRLKSFVNLLSSGNQSPNQLDHAFALWESIKKAQGFPKGFVKWWRTRTIVWVDSPVDLPQGLPTASQASQVFQNFEAHRVRQAKEARLKDPSRIYRDVARPPAVPVQTLVTKSSVIVESSSSDHLTFTFAADKFDTNEPVLDPMALSDANLTPQGPLFFLMTKA